MFELKQLAAHTYYVNSPVRVGLWEREGQAVLIDSGSCPEHAARILKSIRGAGLEPCCVINTHPHADHIGGNRYMAEQTGADCWCMGTDGAFCEEGELGCAVMFGGRPPQALMEDRIMKAPDHPVRDVRGLCLPEGMELLDLPGHSNRHTGVRTPDGVCFVGDSVAAPATLDRYVFPYIYDVRRYRATLERLRDMPAGVYLPSHCEPCESMRPLAEKNLAWLSRRLEELEELLSQPMLFEQLLAALFVRHGLRVTLTRRYMVGSTVMGMLAYLHDESRVRTLPQNGGLYWQRADQPDRKEENQ